MNKNRSVQRALVAAIVLLSINCAGGFQHKVLVTSNVAYESLREVSTLADEAVFANVMSLPQRRDFARTYMLPALTTLDELVTITKSWKSGDPVPVQVVTLARQVLDAYNHIKATLQPSTATDKLLGGLTRAQDDANKFKELYK